MKLNIVSVHSGWILTKIAERLAKHLPSYVDYAISPVPMPGFDCYYYNDIQNCYRNYKLTYPNATHVGYITHAHEDSADWLRGMFNDQGAWRLDGIKSMNERYTKMCKEIGFGGPMLTVTPPAIAEDFPLRKIKLLVANRGGFPGYGHDFMLNLPGALASFLAQHFEFIFVGNSWESVVDKYEQNNIEVLHIPDLFCTYPDEYADLYHQVDYLLVPILWTAGPYCAMEAHLTGLPIIASDVGLINYEVKPDYCFAPGSRQELFDILDKIVSERTVRRQAILDLGDWDSYAQRVVEFIKHCGENDVG